MQIPGAVNFPFYKVALWIFALFVFFTASGINIFISGWNAQPYIYLFFGASILFSFIFYLQIIESASVSFSFIDTAILALLLICFTLILVPVFHAGFFIRDEAVSYFAILILYLPFKHISKRWPKIIPGALIALVIFEIALGCCQFIFAILNERSVLENVTGSFGNTGIYTIFLCCCLPLSFQFSKNAEIPGILKLTCKAIIILTFLFAVVVRSRTAILLFACQIGFLSNYGLRKRTSSSLFKRNMLIIVLLCLLIGLFFLKYHSMIGRLFIWSNALHLFWRKPLFGWGMGGFGQNYLLEQMNYFKKGHPDSDSYKYVAGNVTTAFNEYVELLVNFGVAGMALLGYFLFRVYSIFRKVVDNVGYAGQVYSLVIISALFYYSFHITILLLLMLACLAIASNNSPVIFQLRIPNNSVRFITRTIVVGFGLSAFLYCTMQFKAHKTWQYATLINDEHRSVALGLYEQAYPDLKYRAPFLYNYGAQLYEWGDYSKSIEILEQSRKLTPNIDLLLYLGKAYQQNKQFEKAEQCFIDAVNMVPSKFNPPYFLTTLYMQYGKRDLAIPIARQVLDMPVKVPSPEVDSIRAYMKKIVFK